MSRDRRRLRWSAYVGVTLWHAAFGIGRRGCRHLNRSNDVVGKLYCAGFSPDYILDIGANTGQWTRNTRLVFPKAKYVMLDGLDWTWIWPDLLSTGLVVGSQVVLDREDREVDWYANRFHTGNSMYRERTGYFSQTQPSRVRAHTLDGFLERKGWLFRFALVKLDVQGAELAILSGGSFVLSMAEFVVMELPFAGQYNDGAPSFAEYVAFMDRAGFVPFHLPEIHYAGGIVVQIDIVWTRRGSKWEGLALDAIAREGT
mmetsp:Transcript_82996/g.240119  ORF Transcript_82996/g.240119 Transcript_82996/m.240119 type:complete len:258 (+) Transcript_82996:34-807(+)